MGAVLVLCIIAVVGVAKTLNRLDATVQSDREALKVCSRELVGCEQELVVADKSIRETRDEFAVLQTRHETRICVDQKPEHRANCFSNNARSFRDTSVRPVYP